MRDVGPLNWAPGVPGTPSHLPSILPRYCVIALAAPFCLISGAMMSSTGTS